MADSLVDFLNPNLMKRVLESYSVQNVDVERFKKLKKYEEIRDNSTLQTNLRVETRHQDTWYRTLVWDECYFPENDDGRLCNPPTTKILDGIGGESKTPEEAAKVHHAILNYLNTEEQLWI